MATWLTITSSHLDSHCGEDATGKLSDALDGTDYWSHTNIDEDHWFIIDLGSEYTVTSIRGRSDAPGAGIYEPLDVSIFVSNDKDSWGSAVATGIDTWHDTSAWQNTDTTDKDGRYVKVVIYDVTGDPNQRFLWFGGTSGSYFTIFDVEASKNSSYTQLSGHIMLTGQTISVIATSSPTPPSGHIALTGQTVTASGKGWGEEGKPSGAWSEESKTSPTWTEETKIKGNWS